MNKISSFVFLDFQTIKPYRKTFLFLIALSIFMTVIFESLMIMSFYFMFFLIMSNSYPFSLGEKDRLDILYSTLSLRRRSMVIGRYVFVLCMEFFGILLMSSLSLLFSGLLDYKLVASEFILLICTLSAILSLITAVQYPIYFKMGYNKAKMIAFMPIIAIYGIVMFVLYLSENEVINIDVESLTIFANSNTPLICLLLVAVGILVMAISCSISCKLYEKRDI